VTGTGLSTWVASALIFGCFIACFRFYLLREADPFVRRTVSIALGAKILATFAYSYVVEDVYGSGDVVGYVDAGRKLVPAIRSGALPENALEPGARFTEFLTGLLFTVAGPSEVVGYFVFSMLSFAGMVLLFHAFRLAIPDGDHRRYALLVLLLPTMLFWPSTVGKDAWMVFTLGVGSYGVARILRRLSFGYLFVAAAVPAMAMVRPHIAALFAVSVLAGFVLRPGDSSVKRSAAGWMVGLVLMGIGVSFALLNFSDEMGATDAGEDVALTERIRGDVGDVLERTDQMTSRGGGQFESRPVRGPLDLLRAFGTVPFRPFPWEGHNYQAQIAGMEGLLLFGLVLAALPRLAGLPRRLLRTPYVVVATAYSLGFIVAFSNVGNFGILTRQRAQLLPMLFVLLALPRASSSSDRVPNRQRFRRESSGPLVVEYLPAAEPNDDNREEGLGT
jgi:hypothetical protein